MPAELEGVQHVPLNGPTKETDGAHSQGSAAMVGDPELGTQILNETDFDTSGVMNALATQHPEVASLIRWGSNTQRRPTANGIFERDRYVTPNNIYDQMRVAQDATTTDDVAAGVLESTEALAFNKMSIDTWDEDEEDIWNQIAADLDLDSRLREMWRELFSVSQFYAFTWWGTKSYKVSGRTNQGIKRKRQFLNLKVPLGLSLIDPLRVVPVGNLLFNQEKLAYIATYDDSTNIEPIINGTGQDPVIANMFVAKYEPDQAERKQLGQIGVDPNYLYLLNPQTVWRHTETRPQYKRFAEVRMKSVFELLDLKQQLREMDRAHLIGATNFIVLVKKGSKDLPAQQGEIDNLQNQFRTMARVPVIFGDDRLNIEIITPNNDKTLTPERYNSLDARISARLFQMFMTGNYAAGAKGDDSMKLARVVARGLESRRHMLLRSLEYYVLKPCFEANEEFTDLPSIRFHPKQISLDFDPGLAAFYMDLRDRREISRDTLLAQIDLSETEEARKREREAEKYDDVFKSLTALQDPEQMQKMQLATQKQAQDFQEKQADKAFTRQEKLAKTQGANADTSPSSTGGGGAKTPAKTPQNPRTAGRTKGGTRNGGGAAPGTGQGQPRDARRRAKG